MNIKDLSLFPDLSLIRRLETEMKQIFCPYPRKKPNFANDKTKLDIITFYN